MKQKSWISIVFSFASQCRIKIILSVLCAIISVVAGLIPYWSVYQIISLFIGGSPVMAEVWKWCLIGLAAYAVRFLLYGISTSLSHFSAYTARPCKKIDESAPWYCVGGIRWEVKERSCRSCGNNRASLSSYDT